jgi:hypothetical protein
VASATRRPSASQSSAFVMMNGSGALIANLAMSLCAGAGAYVD